MSIDNESKDREVVEKEEDYEEYDEGEEYEEDEEEYESWVAVEESHFRLKPLVIGLVVVGIVGVGAIVFATSLGDPAKKFDSAPIIQDPDANGSGFSMTGAEDKVLEVKMPEAKPRRASVEKKEETVEPVEPVEPAAEQVVEAPPAEPPAEPEIPEQPADEVAEPAVAEAAEPVVEPEPAAETAGYSDVLEQATKERNRKKKQELLRQAIELNPNGDEALATLAMMLMERGTTRTEALDLATRAVESNPDNGLGWLVIGYVKQVIGKAAEAKEAYRKCASCSGPKKYVRECRLLG